MSGWAGRVGWLGWAAYSCMTSNLGRSKLLRPNSVLGVLGLYGKPIESRFHPFTCKGKWVLELGGKGMLGRAGRVGWPGRAAYSCVTSNFR